MEIKYHIKAHMHIRPDFRNPGKYCTDSYDGTGGWAGSSCNLTKKQAKANVKRFNRRKALAHKGGKEVNKDDKRQYIWLWSNCGGFGNVFCSYILCNGGESSHRDERDESVGVLSVCGVLWEVC